jgi:hypothetical protein
VLDDAAVHQVTSVAEHALAALTLCQSAADAQLESTIIDNIISHAQKYKYHSQLRGLASSLSEESVVEWLTRCERFGSGSFEKLVGVICSGIRTFTVTTVHTYLHTLRQKKSPSSAVFLGSRFLIRLRVRVVHVCFDTHLNECK